MKVSIVGITGYSGLELLKILHGHPNVELVSIHASQETGRPLSALYPYLEGVCDLEIETFSAPVIMEKADLVFLATPSGIAKELAVEFLAADFPVIDLSGDHRLPATSYEKWYGKPAASQTDLDQFIYGLAEFTDVKNQKFIANPGCYATATILALAPLLAEKLIEPQSIIVDAKSGLTGAGKALSEASHFVNVHDNYRTYKLNKHQHIPEIVQALKHFDSDLDYLQFSTSLLPINRGIVATCYARVKEGMDEARLTAAFSQTYADKPFVRLQKTLPELHNVIGSNFTDIGLAYNPVTKVVTVISVIDNLVKGAAGQAVQNLNLMMDWEEELGLKMLPNYL